MREHILRQFSSALITAMIAVKPREKVMAYLAHNHAHLARLYRNAEATLVTRKFAI